MKATIKRLLICALFALIPALTLAQYGYSGPDEIDVNGIFIGGKYTKNQVIAKWGNPTNYRSNTSEFGINETYNYSINRIDNLFRFADNGVFVEFYIRTSNFVVYTAFDGGIKVGDNLSRVQAIGLGTPALQKDGTYRLYRNNADDPLVFTVENGVIKQISFTSSI